MLTKWGKSTKSIFSVLERVGMADLNCTPAFMAANNIVILWVDLFAKNVKAVPDSHKETVMKVNLLSKM